MNGLMRQDSAMVRGHQYIDSLCFEVRSSLRLILVSVDTAFLESEVFSKYQKSDNRSFLW